MSATTELDRMIAWEQGDLSDEETIELFQSLVDSGMAWQLQGMYGRFAAHLIDEGYVTPPKPEKPRQGDPDEAF